MNLYENKIQKVIVRNIIDPEIYPALSKALDKHFGYFERDELVEELVLKSQSSVSELYGEELYGEDAEDYVRVLKNSEIMCMHLSCLNNSQLQVYALDYSREDLFYSGALPSCTAWFKFEGIYIVCTLFAKTDDNSNSIY